PSPNPRKLLRNSCGNPRKALRAFRAGMQAAYAAVYALEFQFFALCAQSLSEVEWKRFPHLPFTLF
ncbi:hypothetical protein ACIBTP_41235, partial [Streptomyces avidinii]|uniref:hypothetical protein n=1 Tax=Streptomyces avidinii TaxID=1895 RepID=UPI00378C2133